MEHAIGALPVLPADHVSMKLPGDQVLDKGEQLFAFPSLQRLLESPGIGVDILLAFQPRNPARDP